MGLFDKFKGIFVIIFLLIVAIIIDPNNPTVVKWVRYIFFGVHAINLIAIFLVHISILNKNEKEKIQFTRVNSTLGALGEDTAKVINVQIKQYDLEQKNVLLKASLIIFALITVLHFLFGWVRILILQIYLPLKVLIIHPMIRVHVLQNEAKGPLSRPWDMYSKIPGACYSSVIRERLTTPKDLKNQKKEYEQSKNLSPDQKAKKMKNRR